ncbi:Glycosyl transferases group 1 [Musa troglodytarum]|uniref:Glycosyl transferases group 1 n=1 Tax=Musa troglodytarum TaxID=320322 RepID=A0A9E7JWQ8_9LILI|nr:Glycosyl transferases group 1 [Musa troglodytarum]
MLHRWARDVPNLAVSWHGISLEVLHSGIYQDLARGPDEPMSPGFNRSLAESIYRVLNETGFSTTTPTTSPPATAPARCCATSTRSHQAESTSSLTTSTRTSSPSMPGDGARADATLLGVTLHRHDIIRAKVIRHVGMTRHPMIVPEQALTEVARCHPGKPRVVPPNVHPTIPPSTPSYQDKCRLEERHAALRNLEQCLRMRWCRTKRHHLG